MKVYPISRSRDLTSRAIETIERAGHQVTLDWTVGSRWYDERDSAIALRDVQAIRDADCVVLMWVPGIKAAFFEMGVAYALKKRIIVVAADPNDMIFFRLPEVEHAGSLRDLEEML